MKRRHNGSESGEPNAEARRNAGDASAEFFESFEISEVSESAGTAESSESSESLKTSKSSKTAEQSKKPKKKSNALLDVLIAISAIFMIGAICLIAYPTFSDWWNRMHQSYAVASYVEQTEDLSGEEKFFAEGGPDYAAAAKAHETLVGRTGAGADFTGWLERRPLAPYRRIAANIRKHARHNRYRHHGIRDHTAHQSETARLPWHQRRRAANRGRAFGGNVTARRRRNHACGDFRAYRTAQRNCSPVSTNCKKATRSHSTCSTKPTRTRLTKFP